MITKKNLLKKAYELENAQDRLVLVGAFYGLFAGTSPEAMLKIKNKDVDFERHTVKVSDSVLVMDSDLEKIIKEAIEEEEYYLLNCTSVHTRPSYNFNMNCEYVLKVKPTKNNNLGLDGLSLKGFRDRFRALTKYLDLIDLNPTKLRQAGALELVESEAKKRKLTLSQAGNFLKDNHMTINNNRLCSHIRKVNIER